MATKFTYTEEVTGEIVQIPIDLLHHHPDNPRKDLGDLTELTDSIKAKGILQNLTVVPRTGAADPGYYVVIGNRRMEAAKSAGLQTLPCIIANMTPAEQVQTMLLENMQRADLTIYEQAMGFQMMLDFGDSIETVSEKTGFSKTTIRRRLKIAELDGDTLKSTSSRQADLMDYDKLSQIEDISVRNKVLAEIGTKNFNNELQKALDAQKIQKRKAGWSEIFSSHGVTEIPYSDVWNSKYESLGYFDGEPDASKIEEYQNQGKTLYFAWGYNSIPYIRADKVVAEEESEEEIEEKRKRAEESMRRTKLSDLAERAFRLRFDFIKNYSIRDSKKNIGKIADWMCLREIVSMMCQAMFTGYATVTASKERFAELYGVKGGDDYSIVAEYLEKHPEKALLMNVYAQWCDSKSEKCTDWDGNYRENPRLINLYQGLCALGYEMSDEEAQMLNGTHELYHNSDESPIDTESDEIESGDEESEDTFDADLKKRLTELLGTLENE